MVRVVRGSRSAIRRRVPSNIASPRAQVVDQGKEIVTEGSRDGGFYIMINGHAEAWVTRDDARTALKSYDQHDYFGEIMMMTDQPRTASVTALTSCKMAVLDKTSFRLLMGKAELDAMRAAAAKYTEPPAGL